MKPIFKRIGIIVIITSCIIYIMISYMKNNISKADIDLILENQKIIFLQSISSYEETYAAGYFIDSNGKKHIYKLNDRQPFRSIGETYEYLLKHYDEFETTDYFDDITLKKCVRHLYCVNKDANVMEKGEVIIDAPEITLYGIRQKNDQEEFVWLGSECGISKKLDDPSAYWILEELEK